MWSIERWWACRSEVKMWWHSQLLTTYIAAYTQCAYCASGKKDWSLVTNGNILARSSLELEAVTCSIRSFLCFAVESSGSFKPRCPPYYGLDIACSWTKSSLRLHLNSLTNWHYYTTLIKACWETEHLLLLDDQCLWICAYQQENTSCLHFNRHILVQSLHDRSLACKGHHIRMSRES